MARNVRRRGLATLLAPVLLAGSLLTAATVAAAAPIDDIPVNPNDPPPFGCTSSSAGRYTVCTNDPGSGDPSQQEPLLDVLIGLTESAQAGDTITIAMFNWWYRKTGDPFDYSKMQTFTHGVIAAAGRGVTVNIALDEHSAPSQNPELDQSIDQPWDELTDPTDPNAVAINFVACGESSIADSRCLEDPAAATPIQHNKLILFDLGGVKHVAVSSANFGAAGMAQLYQNTVKITGDEALHGFFTDYWTRLAADDWDGWTTAGDRVRQGSANPATSIVETKGYVYPHPEFVDTLANLLEGVTECPGSGDRKVWLIVPSFNQARLTANGDRLTNALKALVTMGCGVKIVASDSMSAETREALSDPDTGAGAELVTVPQGCIHSKSLIVDAVSTDLNGNNPAQRTFVWTGSSNFTSGAAWVSPNSNVRVEDATVVRKYISNYTSIWNRNNDPANPDPACG